MNIEYKVNYTFVTPFSMRYEWMEDYNTIPDADAKTLSRAIAGVFKPRGKNIRNISISVFVPGNMQAIVVEKSYPDESVYKINTYDGPVSLTGRTIGKYLLQYVRSKAC